MSAEHRIPKNENTQRRKETIAEGTGDSTKQTAKKRTKTERKTTNEEQNSENERARKAKAKLVFRDGTKSINKFIEKRIYKLLDISKNEARRRYVG